MCIRDSTFFQNHEAVEFGEVSLFLYREEIVMDKQQIVSFINENMFGIWFLIGAALVFWMQAGFAMRCV